MPVKILEDQYDSDNVCTRKVVIHCCRVCGGFYKQEYRAINYPSGWLDVDEGWDIQDHYFKIEEPSGDAHNCSIPLTIEDARTFGCTGEDFTWKDNRCNFNLQKVELTCRLRDLKFMGYPNFSVYPEDSGHSSRGNYL